MKNLTKEQIKKQKKFEKFYDKNRGLIYTVIRKYYRGGEEFQDVFQEVLLNLYTAYDDVKYDFNDPTLVYTIVKNATINYGLKVEKYENHVCYINVEGHSPVTKDLFRISSLKNVLTEQEYELIYNVYVLNISIKEHADMHNQNYNSVKSNHLRILKKLKHELKEFCE